MYIFPDLNPSKAYKRIAVLTSGGDAPGMNAAIRAVVRAALTENVDVMGIYRGYSGLVNSDVRPLTSASVANILQRGGTILKTDRCEAFKESAVRWQAAEQLRDMGIDALVVIGGDGSLTGAYLLGQETGLPVIGVPATIDNDIAGTEDTIGFDTAVNTALDSIDRIRDTANSHERIFLIEVMGRNTGFIAAHAGIAGGAEIILAPDRTIDLEAVSERLQSGIQGGKLSSHIVLVAEGRQPGRTERLARALQDKGYDPRVCILGHTQRGGAPSGHDRVLASCLGATAVSFLLAGYAGVTVGVNQRQIIAVPLDQVIGQRKTLDANMLNLASRLQE